jgi:hypothetical protein
MARDAVGVQADDECPAPARQSAVLDIGQVQMASLRPPRHHSVVGPLSGLLPGPHADQRQVSADDGQGGAEARATSEGSFDALENPEQLLPGHPVGTRASGNAPEKGPGPSGDLRGGDGLSPHPLAVGHRRGGPEDREEDGAQRVELASDPAHASLEALGGLPGPSALPVDGVEGVTELRPVALPSPSDPEPPKAPCQVGGCVIDPGSRRAEVPGLQEAPYTVGQEASLDPVEVEEGSPAGAGPCDREPYRVGDGDPQARRESMKRGAVGRRIRRDDLHVVPRCCRCRDPAEYLAELVRDGRSPEDLDAWVGGAGLARGVEPGQSPSCSVLLPDDGRRLR